MRNIIALLKDTAFPRIRVGFKPKEELQIPLIDYVLSKIKDEALFNAITDKVGDCAFDFASGKGTQFIMQKYNGAVK
jgi:peptidyl-tRNA hydrolase